MSYKVLVCGGRDYANQAYLTFVLDQAHKSRAITEIIHGAARGADALARDWATKNKIMQTPFPADWERHGKSAGILRNLEMLKESQPDLVLAFPGGKGTAHMCKIAAASGVRIVKSPI